MWVWLCIFARLDRLVLGAKTCMYNSNVQVHCGPWKESLFTQWLTMIHWVNDFYSFTRGSRGSHLYVTCWSICDWEQSFRLAKSVAWLLDCPFSSFCSLDFCRSKVRLQLTRPGWVGLKWPLCLRVCSDCIATQVGQCNIKYIACQH